MFYADKLKSHPKMEPYRIGRNGGAKEQMDIPPEAEALLFAKIALINVSSYIQILQPILHNFRSLGKPFWLF